jgi:undecaprenyl-diphosphatase
MMMRVAERRLTKIYCMSLALMVTFLVGVSRVFLGVHYPTDVLGGWMIGFVWASICWIGAQRLEARTHVVADERKHAEAVAADEERRA